MTNDRFEEVHFERPNAKHIYSIGIVKDLETGVLYGSFKGGSHTLSVIPLIDADGKPLVDKEE